MLIYAIAAFPKRLRVTAPTIRWGNPVIRRLVCQGSLPDRVVNPPTWHFRQHSPISSA